MNYSEYCRLKTSQYNFADRSVSYVSSTGNTGASEAARAAREAVNKAVWNLKGAIKDQVEGKVKADTSKANKIVDGDKLYEVEVGKSGTDIKPKVVNSTGFNKERRDLANEDVKRKNENKSEFSNTKTVLKSGNQVAKMLPEEYKTRQSINKDFESNLSDGNSYA